MESINQATWTRIDELAARYQALWQGGQPELRAFVAEAGAIALGDLVSLVRIDQRCRLERQIETPTESYLAAFPELGGQAELGVEIVYGEYLTRLELGQKPTIDEFVKRFPNFAERLRQQIELHDLLADTTAVDAGPGGPPMEGIAETPGLPRVAGFELLGELGRGAMGIVYKARQIDLKRLVALKMIRATEWADQTGRERFRAEAEAVARLRHPNIVQIYDVGDSSNQPFLVLEYVDTGTLAAKWHGEPQPARTAAELIQTLAGAAEHAHRAGVIHRDLKPANVLLAADGTPKIADFGLAKRLDSVSMQTQTGAALGTPAYMAPEQAAGDAKHVGPATDIYALGAILYEALTGRPPFKADTHWNTFHLILHNDPVPPRRLNPAVPRDLETICLKCLQKSPAKRYATAQALADDLGRFLDGKPIHARPTAAWEHAWKWAKRRPAIAILASTLAAVIVSAFIVVTQQLHHEAEVRREAQRNEAEMALDRGIDLCKRGDIVKGLHLFLRCLEVAPADAIDLRQAAVDNLSTWESYLRHLQLRLDHGGPLHGAALRPDGSLIATAGEDGKVRVWATGDGRLIDELDHVGPVHAVAFSGDGMHLVIGVGRREGNGGEAIVRSVSEAKVEKIERTLDHGAAVLAVAISKNGDMILTGGQDHQARLWKGGSTVLARDCHAPVIGVALAPDGILAFLSVLADLELPKEPGVFVKHPAVRAWQLTNGKLGAWFASIGPARAMAFSGDGKTMLAEVGGPTEKKGPAAILRPIGLKFKDATHLYHPTAVSAVAYGPEDTLLLTGCIDGMVRLWTRKTATPKLHGAPIPHPASVRTLACSGEGDQLMVACANGNVFVWGLSRLLAEVPPPAPWQKANVELPSEFSPVAAYLPDGKKFVAAYAAVPPEKGSEKLKEQLKEWGCAGLWDVATRAPTGDSCPPQKRILALAHSPDGSRAVLGSQKRIVLWDLISGSVNSPEAVQKNLISAVAWSSDANGKELVASASWDGTVALFDGRDGKHLGTIQHPPPDEVYAIAFSPDGRLLATGAADGAIRLWNPRTQEQIATAAPLKHSAGPVLCLAFHPGGRMLISAAADSTARRWEIPSGKSLGEPMPHPAPVRALAVSSDGELIATATGGKQGPLKVESSVHFWTARNGKAIGPAYALAGPIRSLSFRPDGVELLCAAGGTSRAGFAEIGESPPRFEFLRLPRRLPADLHALRMRVEVLTGRERTATGEFRPVTAARWKAEREELQRRGLLESSGTRR